jgi:hypothetical protein
MTAFSKNIYRALALGQSYYRSGSILYAEAQVRDALPFLVQSLDQSLVVYVEAVTGVLQKSKTRGTLLNSLKNDPFLHEIKTLLNSLESLIELTENSMTPLPDNKKQHLDTFIRHIEKVYVQVNHVVRKKYPSAVRKRLDQLLSSFFKN